MIDRDLAASWADRMAAMVQLWDWTREQLLEEQREPVREWWLGMWEYLLVDW